MFHAQFGKCRLRNTNFFVEITGEDDIIITRACIFEKNIKIFNEAFLGVNIGIDITVELVAIVVGDVL